MVWRWDFFGLGGDAVAFEAVGAPEEVVAAGTVFARVPFGAFAIVFVAPFAPLTRAPFDPFDPCAVFAAGFDTPDGLDPAFDRGARAGGDRSTVTSAATRREPFRAGGAAGTISAGRSARVRGATMVREV